MAVVFETRKSPKMILTTPKSRKKKAFTGSLDQERLLMSDR